ncbi:MAG TPA: helicase-related protein [bacterium]|nr:helicase-related protein [bacterium]
MKSILKKIQALIADWQERLGDGVKIILGGSLVSDLFILDHETKVIDVDVRFLVNNPEDEKLRVKIESVTGLKYRKTISVADWPTGSSAAVMVEGVLTIPGVGLPLDIEGCIRNPKYVGWAQYYRQVLTPEELESFRQQKSMLRHNKAEYKNLKSKIRQMVEDRCLATGIIKKNQNGKSLGLPFWKKADEIVALAQSGRGVVVMPTGTGKTTQTPQALHEAGFTRNGMIYISVPKRILAVELATRVAEEMEVSLGDLVGYEIRGEKKAGRNTKILFMTEGMLRVKIRNNPTLKGVSVILFDEFHQRSIMSDFNVALVERAQNEGSKVAFLLMSATTDAQVLASHFNCDMVDGSDLTTVYPIIERYEEGNGESLFSRTADQVATMITKHGDNVNGLVFMPGKAEIVQTIEAINKLQLNGVTVLALHGDLNGKERHAPFTDHSGVTVTVATDIVETGATLPNIGWVVDSGLAREVGYDPISDTSSLHLTEVAKDRLIQRRGRCGRVRSGEYVALFSSENKDKRPAKTKPEILRKPLREIVLTIKALGLSRIGNSLRLIDNPEKANWKEAKRQLQMLGFVDETPDAQISLVGKKAIELGCDPRDAAMLFKATELGCLREMAIAIAARGIRLLYVPRNEEEGHQARSAHNRFKTSTTCDSWTAIQVVRAAENKGEESIGSFCRKNFISYRGLQELWQAEKQLTRTMKNFGFDISNIGTEENLCKSIAAGLPDRVFEYYRRPNWYSQVNGDTSAALGKESLVSSGKIVAWEMIEIQTSRGGMKLITNAAVVI